jgi:hypothetical protein
MIYLASFLLGSVIGLICVTIFTVILRRIEEKKPYDAVRALTKLIYIILGGGLTDFVIFEVIFGTKEAIKYYLIGFTIVFLLLGFWAFKDWFRGEKHERREGNF